MGEGTAISSRDGFTWSPLSLPTVYSVRSIAVRGRRLVAVGDGGVTLVSVDGGRRWERARTRR
jgi:photosystem II stability/assembly factor-like uncharacterized protein